ncbi:MAG: hypothetical protein ACTTIS_01530 [Streptobacillus sp.]|jgi:hypothetical protein
MIGRVKVINRDSKSRDARLNLIQNVELHTMKVLFLGVSIVTTFLSFNIYTHKELTNIAHSAYVVNKQIDHTLREIDSMKSDLLKNTNILNVQSESSSQGFVFNNDLKFVK